MRKKILSIYLVAAILFLSVATSAVPVYASNSTNWEDYFSITYTATNTNSPYSLDFKSTTAESAYKILSKDERKKVDYDAFMAISAKGQNHSFGNLVFNNTTIPDLIKGIASSAGMVMSGKPDDTGFNADLQDKLTRISNSISASNRKFGGGGMSFASSSTNPSNFGLGKLTLSKDFINDLRSRVAKYLYYTIYPSLPSDPKEFYSIFTTPLMSFSQTFFESHFTDWYNSGERGFVIYDSDLNNNGPSYRFYFFGSENYIKNSVFYFDNTYLYSFNNYTSTSITRCNSSENIIVYMGSGLSAGLSSDDIRIFNQREIFGVTGMPIMIFNTKQAAQAYLNYLNGTEVSNYYISTKTVENDYSTTINKMYDYSTKNTYETINNNITQAITDKGSGLTDEEYQKIVDEVMEKVQTEIDSKPDTGDSGSSGGGSTGGGSSGGISGGSGADSGENTWLEKIFNRLGDILEKIGTVTGIETILEYLKQIAVDLTTLKEGGTLSADLSDTNGLLKDIKKLLGTLIAVQAVGDIADLLADTVGDKISDYADNVKSAATEVTDVLQEVFPFSIPWDLMAIFALFAAEPVAPEFDIPVKVESLGIEHTIHIDFTNFEQISTMSRAFLSVIFACGLMYLTIRLTNGGNDDD